MTKVQIPKIYGQGGCVEPLIYNPSTGTGSWDRTGPETPRPGRLEYNRNKRYCFNKVEDKKFTEVAQWPPHAQYDTRTPNK